MPLKRVLIVNKSLFPSALDVLKGKVEVTVIPYLDYEPETLQEIKEQLPQHDAVIWNTKHRLTREMLDIAGPRLQAVSTVSSGTNHIDVEELKKRNIPLGNCAGAMNSSVANIAIGLLIAASRRFKEGNEEIISGTWRHSIQLKIGTDIDGSTVGIIGFGGIGQTIAKRLKVFDVAKFLYSGRSEKREAKSLGVERVPLEQLFRESDFIILSCPLTEETRHLINTHSLEMMKRNAVIINIARGDIINQDALYLALKEKRIFAAGLDVVTPEPIPKDHPLLSLANCYILPHMGTATEGTRSKMASMAANNILLSLNGQPMLHPVY